MGEREEGEGMTWEAREAERAELQSVKEKLQQAQEQLQAKDRELHESNKLLHSASADVEAARAHEREEIKKLLHAHVEKEAQWRENLEWVKAAAIKAETDRLASERAARKARWEADTAAEERRWLEGEVKRLSAKS